MLVKFRVNLGSIDAAALKLDYKHCTAGAEVEVGDDVAALLFRSGTAEEVRGVAKTPELRGVKNSDHK